MKSKQGFSLVELLIVVTIIGILTGLVKAGEVYDRTQVTLGTSGSKTWTNDNAYAAIELLRFEVLNGTYAADTITVKRVTAGDTTVITNTVTGLLLASGAGSSNLINAAGFGPRHLKYGDKLLLTSGNSSNATVNIEYIVLKH